jgi:hypothetical protein
MKTDLATLTLAVQSFTDGRFTMDKRKYVSRLPYAGDLNSVVLENIYSGIKSNFGELAATNFVRLVNSLEDLSAHTFELALRQFWENDCSTTEVIQCSIRQLGIFDFQLSNQSEKNLVKKESLALKKPFILNHFLDIPESERINAE